MSALDIQIGGEHYKNAKIQPIQYIEANRLGFLEGCVVKRVTRHDKPTGKGRQDIEKAIHELQLLLEFRYPQCPECGYPTDAAGTHYATCSQLTAPEEYKAEAQVAFDEAAELSEALARQVSAGQIPDPAYSHCPHCGSPEGYLHNPDCTTMRRGKSRLGKTLAEIRAAQAAQEEPAAAMDDDSPRMKIIGQGGELAEEVYAAIDAADTFAAAPLWANYRAQDADGEWFHYSHEPVPKDEGVWVRSDAAGNDCEFHTAGEPNPHWRDTLITRT